MAACVCLAYSDDSSKLLPAGAGKDTLIRACTDCHNTDNIRKKRLTSDEWADEVADMVERGAQANAEDQAVIVDYLAQNFGQGSKVWVNTAPLGELRVQLALSTDEANAVIAYRTAHGDFKEWRDLLKVPGVDAKNIEAKKDLMRF